MLWRECPPWCSHTSQCFVNLFYQRALGCGKQRAMGRAGWKLCVVVGRELFHLGEEEDIGKWFHQRVCQRTSRVYSNASWNLPHHPGIAFVVTDICNQMKSKHIKNSQEESPSAQITPWSQKPLGISSLLLSWLQNGA